MRIYVTDYDVRDEEAYKSAPTKFPKYVVASGFDSAVASAKAFETDQLSLRELKLAATDGFITIESGFTGLVKE